jgi:hypothetical protein
MKFSPVFDIVTNTVPVKVTLAANWKQPWPSFLKMANFESLRFNEGLYAIPERPTSY